MKNFFKRIWLKTKRFLLIAFLLHLGYAIVLIWVHAPITITMIANKINGHAIRYEPIDFSNQGKQLKLAAIASEDQKFPDHFGFDFNSIKLAFEKNAEGEKIRGGSTITQQTAKNLFLWQGRDWIRKGLEAYSALIMELIWSKEKILEHYLNIAEMGDGVYGVQAAAKYYYNTNANNLSAEQAASIIASLPNPKKMNPNKRTRQLNRRKNWIQRQMRNLATHGPVKELITN